MLARTGQLELEFRRDGGGRTYLHRQFAAYPFHVCRPYYDLGDPPGLASLYLQSLAGGIFEGDRLSARVVARRDAQAHVTSQAATLVHGMKRAGARYETVIVAQRNSLLEHMPDSTILFPDALLDICLTVRAAPGARVIASDVFLFHDPSGLGRPFTNLRSEVRVEAADGALLACDRFTVGGAAAFEALPGAMDRYRAMGSLYFIAPTEACEPLLALLRGAVPESHGVYAGVSTLPNHCGLWMRLLAAEAHDIHRAIRSAWSALRLALYGKAPRERRK